MKLISILGAFLIGSMFLAGCQSSSPGQPANAAHQETFSPTPSAPTEVITPSVANSNSSGPDIERDGFLANLPADFIQPSDETGRRLLKEYGAVFLARGSATPPKTVVFRDENEVAAFQGGVPGTTESVGGVTIHLQAAAMQALKEAAAEAAQSGAFITPKGADAAARSYRDTVGLWASRVDPGLAHWTAKRKISAAEAARIRALPPFDQVPEILKLESRGDLFFKGPVEIDPIFGRAAGQLAAPFDACARRCRARQPARPGGPCKTRVVPDGDLRSSAFYISWRPRRPPSKTGIEKNEQCRAHILGPGNINRARLCRSICEEA